MRQFEGAELKTIGLRSAWPLALVMALGACSKKADPGVAYVSSQNGGISVYSLDKFEKIKEIQVGEGARGLGLSDDGKLLAVAVKESGELVIVDTTTGTVKARVPVGKNPEFVRVLGDVAFVAYEPSSKGGPPKPDAAKTEGKPEDDEDEDEDPPAQVALVDLKQAIKLREITAGRETEGIEFSQDGKHLIVTNEADENVSVHQIDTGALVTRLNTESYGVRPRGIKRSGDGKEFAVTLEFGNKVLILNDQYQVVREAATGPVPYGVTFNKAGDELLVALAKGERIQVFDSKTLAVKREYPVGRRCWHFTFTPDEKNLLVACGRSSEVLVLDAKTGQKLKTLPDDKLPWGVVVYPKAKGSLDTPLK